MSDFNPKPGPFEPLSEERIQEIIREDAIAYAAAEDAARAERLTGRRCACCDKPMPGGQPGSECAECADLSDL